MENNSDQLSVVAQIEADGASRLKFAQAVAEYIGPFTKENGHYVFQVQIERTTDGLLLTQLHLESRG